MIAASVAMVGIVIMVVDGLGHGRLLGQAYSFLMTGDFRVAQSCCSGAIPACPSRRSTRSRRWSRQVSAIAIASATIGSRATKSACSALFGITTITIAFALFMEGAKHVPPAEASLIAMLDVVMGPLWVLIAFGERPDTRR